MVAVTAVTAVAARVRAGGGERPCSQSALETKSEGTEPALRSHGNGRRFELHSGGDRARAPKETLGGDSPALR